MQTLFEINCGVKSDVGRVRKNNEDSITYFIPTDVEELKKNGSLFIVADGVGGAAKGEVASHFAADTVIYEYYNNEELPPAERLAKAIEHASREIFNHSQANGNFTRMATTIVAALVLQNNLIVAHVGDSRLYLVREGKIKQITRDHSVVAEMVRNGLMTEEEARTSKAKNRISRSVGGEAEVKVDVSEPISLKLRDRILLCSDGLTRYLDGEELKIAVQKGDVEAVPKELIKYANSQGGVDNVSAILLEIVEKAKIHIKKPVHPKVPPVKLGWDEAQTEYGKLSSPRRSIPVWGWIGGAVVVVAILFFGIFSLFGNKKQEEELPETNTPVATTGVAEIKKPDVTEIPVQSDPHDDSGADPSSESDVGVITSTSNGQWECLYEVHTGSGDTMESILNSFGLFYDPITHCGKSATDINYFYYIDCSDENESFQCKTKQSYQNGNRDLATYNPVEWIIIYSSNDDGNLCYIDNEKVRHELWGKENCEVSLDGSKTGIIYELRGGDE